MSVVTPIGALDYRLPQAGRIRTGEKVWSEKRKKYLPTTLDSFRFTTGERDLLVPLAERYGGEIKPWDAQGSGDKWMVDTKATKIEVQVHVAGSLSLAYEMWDPHMTRRCNGTTCALLVETPDDAGFQEVECVCARKGQLECDTKLRLSVLLPGTPTIGTWRWDSGSDNAIKEIRGFFKYMQEWAGNGLHACMMRLEERRQPGKKFKVVVLDYEGGSESLLAGESRLVQLPATTGHISAGELEAGKPPVAATPSAEPVAGEAGEGDRPQAAGPSPASPPTDDDEIVDAEIVEDAAREWLDKLPQSHRNAALRKAREIARQHGEPEPTVAAAIPDHILQLLMEEAGDDARVRTDS
jgi:hypothetical protein